MSFKKAAVLSNQSSAYICWSCLTNAKLPPPSSRTQQFPACPRKRSRRTYTTAIGHESQLLQWPDLKDPRRIPTPYQIFNQEPTDEYSKHRFYELVKIYHPDRATAQEPSADADKNIERYRLVIAANAILSDPDKRLAYDRYGAGWASIYEDSDMNREKWKRQKYSTYRYWQTEHTTTWSQWSTDSSPMFNATWEDWERWYEQQRDPEGYARRNSWNNAFFSSRRPSNTVFANNHVFLSVVALLAALGGIGQATRANQLADNRRQRMDAFNERVGRDLLEARNDARETSRESTKGERIKKWVRQKEGYSDGEPDGRTTRLGDDFCGSNAIKDKDEEPFWKRPPEAWER